MLATESQGTITGSGTRLRRNPNGPDETLTPLEHARRIAGLAQEKLAQDVLILDMRPVCSYTDFFVLWHGRVPTPISPSQLHAGDRISVRIRAPGAFALGQVEQVPANHVGDHQPA